MKTTREFCPADRYVYDRGVCSFKNGFAQIDTPQDAAYFGMWASPKRRVIFTYCEGDCITEEADTDAEFVAAMRKHQAWHKESDYKFAVDGMCQPEIIKGFQELGLGDLLH